jgi:hypothetical protein
MKVPRLQRRLAPTVGLVMALALSLTPSAFGDAAHTIVQRCTHGESLAGFPPSAYAKALKDLSATTEEYSDCAQLIRRAQEAASSGHGSAAGLPSTAAQAVATSPAEQKAIAAATKNGSAPVRLDGQVIRPGVVHANIASAFSTLPSPVLALLAFLLACLVVFAGGVLRRRLRDGRAH